MSTATQSSDTFPSAAEAPRPFQFSLRALFVVVTLSAIALAVVPKAARGLVLTFFRLPSLHCNHSESCCAAKICSVTGGLAPPARCLATSIGRLLRPFSSPPAAAGGEEKMVKRAYSFLVWKPRSGGASPPGAKTTMQTVWLRLGRAASLGVFAPLRRNIQHAKNPRGTERQAGSARSMGQTE